MSDQPPINHSDATVTPRPEEQNPPGINPLLLYAEGIRQQRQQQPDISTSGLSPTQVDAQINALRTTLNTWADRNLVDQYGSNDGRYLMLNGFKANMEQFEKHAEVDGISREEVLKTYQQIARLTEPGSVNALNETQRNGLICDAMHGVAGERIFQGGTLACNVSCVQDRTNALFPAEATKLLADVVQHGQYHASDGTIVSLNVAEMAKPLSITTAEMARNESIGDARSSLYERIWQTTAIDLNYAKENNRTGKDIHYEQRQVHPFGDSGERLVDYSKHPPEEKVFTGLTTVEIAQVSNMITGRNEKDVVLVHSNAHPEDAAGGPGVTVIHSEKELASKLVELKHNHKLPVIIDEYNATEPFYTEANSALVPASGHWSGHVVTVKDYDANTGNTIISNPSKPAEAKNDFVSVHDLNVAMQLPKAAENDVAAYVQTLRAENTEPGQTQQAVKSSEQFVNEVQLFRLRVSNEETNDAQAEQQLRAYIHEAYQRKATGRLSEKQSDAEIQEIENTIGCLPPAARVHSYRYEHQEGLIDDKEYFVKLQVLEGYVQGLRNSLPFAERWFTPSGNNQAFYDELYRSYAELPWGMKVSPEEAQDIVVRRHLNL
jgi:hypothetical protein